MAKRVKKKIEKSEMGTSAGVSTHAADATVYDSPEVLQEQIGRSQQYLEKNKQAVTGVAIALVVLMAVIFAFNRYQDSKEKEAQADLSPAIFYFEKDSLGKALNGDNNTTIGLLGVADEYSSTDAGNLANFYIGASYMKMKKFDVAIDALKSFSTSDDLIQARAYSLIGDAYMEKKEYGSAVDYYQKSTKTGANDQFTPAYMMKLGLAHELNGDATSAKSTYAKLVKEYPQAREINNAKKYLAQE